MSSLNDSGNTSTGGGGVNAQNHPQPQMATTVANVAEIFNAAGFAFKKLAEMINSIDDHLSNGTSDGEQQQKQSTSLSTTTTGTHWEADDVEHFRTIVCNFNEELNTLSNNLKSRMVKNLKVEHTTQAVNKLSTSDRDVLHKFEDTTPASSIGEV